MKNENSQPTEGRQARLGVRKAFIPISLLPLLLLGIANRSFAEQDLIQTLLQHGVAPEQIFGVDSDGIPLVCGTTHAGESASHSTQHASPGGLPVGTRGWQTIPGVIRNDGLETFRVEVDVNGPVAGVIMSSVSASLIPPQPPPFDLRDDGLGSDRIAGDFVFTTGPFRYNPSVPFPDFYQNDATSPAGLSTKTIGEVTIADPSGTTNAGVHSSVQGNYTGTGLGLFDNSASFGSHGRLLGVNVLDAYDRGILSNGVATSPSKRVFGNAL